MYIVSLEEFQVVFQPPPSPAAESGRVAIGNDFRLHNGHQALALRDGGIASQGVHGICDRQLCGHMLRRVQLQHVAPLGKAGALLIGLGAKTPDMEENG